MYDTGGTPYSYFRDKPNNFISKEGFVTTANDERVKTLGSCDVKIGNLHLKNVIHVPSFKFNLLYGIQIMKSGYTQVIKDDLLEIRDKNGSIVAAGQYNSKSGLIELKDEMTAQMVKQSANADLWHRKLAHFNLKTVLRNLKLNSIEYTDNQTECLDCLNGKAHSTNLRKSKKEYDVLKLIESDTTPFPITSYDGSSHSLKFVDAKTGYIHSSIINDLKSRTILDELKSFKSRVERRSNKELKILRTDGGSEYKGVVMDFLISEGILKQTGSSTRKHIPARAEMAHRTILELARCSHSFSKLPLKFY